jgi:hypothetical protein
MALDQLIGNPDYENANIATKNAIFENFAKSDPNFTNANEATKEAIRDRFGISQRAIDLQFQSAGTPSVLDTKGNQRSLGGVVKQSAIKGVSGLGDIVGGFPQDISNLYEYFTTKNAPIPQKSRPVTGFLQRQGVLTPENEPNNPMYKAIDFTTQVATSGGLNPASLARSATTLPVRQASGEIGKQLGRTALAGGTGSAVQQGMEYSGASPIQQMIGTGLAMGGTGAVTGGVRSTPADIVNRNLKGVTPEGMRLAQMLQQDSIKLGMPITGAEAIAQATGQRGLTTTQRFLEQAEPSQATMNQFMAGRPAGVQQGFGNVMQSVSPRAPTSATPFNLQQAGKDVIRGAERNLTESVNPFYKQGMSEMQTLQMGKPLPVLPSEVAALKSNKELGPAIQDAISKVTQDSYYKVKGLPESDPRVLNAAKIYLDTQYKNFSKTMSDTEDAIKAGTAWGASRELDSYLSSKSPSYAQGSRNYEVAQKTQFAPMERGPVGQIAEGNVGRDVLMPPAPISLYPADIKRTADLLRRKDPNALPDWTRQNLEGIFNETTQNLATGQNQFGGAKFASTIAGNKQQRDNLRTLVTETGGMQAWQGFEKFLDVAQAQGQRMPANSATAFNEMIKDELGTGKISKGLTFLKPSNIVAWAENVQLGRNADMLAKMLTDPDSVAKLQELAKTGPKSARAQTLANSIAGAYVAPKPEITEESK